MSSVNNHQPLVSIACATYNGEKYLVQQLESLINQTYKNIEIIIVDDKSEDSTVAIIQNYVAKHNFIKYKQNSSNIGVVKTFERAIMDCSGEFIALCDQDDIWYLNKIEVLIKEIGDRLLIHSDAMLIDEQDRVISESYMRSHKSQNVRTFTDYLKKNNVTGCTMLVSRELIKLALPIPMIHVLHDHYFAIIASFYKKIKYLDTPLVYYRQHTDNVIGAVPQLSFDSFLVDCKNIANDYGTLLTKNIFRDNKQIKLFRDFRYGISQGYWQSGFSIFDLLKIRGGIGYIVYFYIMTGFGSRRLARLLYNKVVRGIK